MISLRSYIYLGMGLGFKTTPASFQILCSYHYTTVPSLNKHSCENVYSLDKYYKSTYKKTLRTIVLNIEGPGLSSCFIR